MKHTLPLFLILITFTFTQSAFSQIELPQPSPAGKVYTKVGLTDVEVEYARPKAKGRKIFGEGSDYLVPFDQIWRTGANNGTLVRFSDDVKIEGNNVPSGEYLLLTIPGAEQWQVIFYKDPSIGGNMAAFKDEDVQVKVNVKPSRLSESVETLTFNIADLSEMNETANIELAWENTSVKVSLSCEFDERVMTQIEKNTKVNPSNYIAAANYYYNTDRDMQQALKWVNMYFDSNPNFESQFWNLYLKAQIQAKTGDKKGAIETAQKSIEIAKNNPGGDFGYVKRNEDLIQSLK